MDDFTSALTLLIIEHARGKKSNTPSTVLAQYLVTCLEAYEAAVLQSKHAETLNDGLRLADQFAATCSNSCATACRLSGNTRRVSN